VGLQEEEKAKTNDNTSPPHCHLQLGPVQPTLRIVGPVQGGETGNPCRGVPYPPTPF